LTHWRAKGLAPPGCGRGVRMFETARRFKHNQMMELYNEKPGG